ncbi:MAG TPA: RidA family protein [Gemmatimonadaceae bacterium]|jgi:enamine deaminase RidA (YjgF/YER057c/UK114 family)
MSDGDAGPPDARALHPPGWAPPRGYGNGVVAEGRHVVLAGQVGWNPATCAFEHHDMGGQVEQALRNVAALLAEAGAEPRHLVRLTWYVADRAAYLAARREIGRAYREIFGLHYPPMTVVVVAGLVEEEALVEIEATAVVG